MANTEAVIFDLGRVLVDVRLEGGLWERLRPLFESEDETFLPIYREYASGRLTPGEFHERVCAWMKLKIAYPDFARNWCAIFSPIAGMEALFGEVAGRIRVGLLSDTDPLHWAHIRKHHPFVQRIPDPALSFEIGALKPAPEAYLAAAAKVALPEARCLFIDDRAENVQGALDRGMDALRFEGEAALRLALVARGIL